MPTDLWGIGSIQRSGANAARPSGVWSGCTATHSTWLVPSRKRVEYGRSADITTARPSGDQLGRPGSKRRPCTCRCSRVATCTTRSCEPESRYASCVPSGDHAAVVPSVARRRSAPVDRSRAHSATAPSRSDENASVAPSGDHTGLVSTNTSLVTRRGTASPARVETSHRSPSAAKATVEPSGEIVGCIRPRTGCGPSGGKARRAGVNAARVNATSAENATRRAAPPTVGRRFTPPSAA